jgi:hypothetical protein
MFADFNVPTPFICASLVIMPYGDEEVILVRNISDDLWHVWAQVLKAP